METASKRSGLDSVMAGAAGRNAMVVPAETKLAPGRGERYWNKGEGAPSLFCETAANNKSSKLIIVIGTTYFFINHKLPAISFRGDSHFKLVVVTNLLPRKVTVTQFTIPNY
jgi:hypothetical protein